MGCNLNVKSIDYLKPLANISNYYRPLDIFTTNYDTNIERTCEKTGKGYVDGFNPRWNPILFNKDSDIRLFKLHGSISWYRTEQGDYEKSSIQSTDMGVKLTSGEDAVPIILYPGRKLQYIEPVLEMLAFLKTKLTEARYCILIGYSFKDDHLSKLFKYAARVNKDLIVILVAPDSYQTYQNSLKRHIDAEFVHGFSHENFHPNDFNVDRPSELKGRVVYLPYTIQKILPILKKEYLDKLTETEILAGKLKHSPPRDLISDWKNCLKNYMECEYLEKVDSLLNQLAQQDLSWKELASIDWRFTFEISLRGMINSLVCSNLNHKGKWKARLDEVTSFFKFDNFIFIPALGMKTLTFPPHIGLFLNIYNSNVASQEIVHFIKNIIIPIIKNKLSILENNSDKYLILSQLLVRIEGFISYISIWQTYEMTFVRYFDLRKNSDQNQINSLKEAYEKFYHNETENDQEAVRQIIFLIEQKIFTQDIIDILNEFNL